MQQLNQETTSSSSDLQSNTRTVGRQIQLVLPDGTKRVFSEHLLRHIAAWAFSPLTDRIFIEKYITRSDSEGNFDEVSLQDLARILRLIEEGHQNPHFNMQQLLQFSLGGTRSNAWCMHALQIADYFKIQPLFDAIRDYIGGLIGGDTLNSQVLNALAQLPDDLQAQMVSMYVPKNRVIMEFLESPYIENNASLNVSLSAEVLPYYKVGIKNAVGNIVCVLEGHCRDITCVSWSQDHSILATASDDGSIRIWNASTGRELLKLKGARIGERMSSVAFNFDNSSIVAGSDIGLYLWSVQLNSEKVLAKNLFVTESAQQKIVAVSFSRDGTVFAAACVSTYEDDKLGGVEVRNAQTGELLAELIEKPSIKGIYWSPDGKQLAIIFDDATDTVHVSDVATKICVFSCGDYDAKVTSVRWSADGSKFSTIANQVYTWNLSSPDLFSLTLQEVQILEKVITDQSMACLNAEEVGIYKSLPTRWKDIIAERFIAPAHQGGASYV